jgi:hypothetical protein
MRLVNDVTDVTDVNQLVSGRGVSECTACDVLAARDETRARHQHRTTEARGAS